MSTFSYGIITVSDRCHKNESVDESGPAIKQLLQNSYQATKIMQSTVPDEQYQIEEIILMYVELKLNCVFTTGGTGFAPRDVTPEATRKVIERECPQLSTVMLLEGLKNTSFAALTRGICGIRNQTLIINFPGSKKAVVESFNAIREIIPHAIQLICDMKSKTEITHRDIQSESKSNSIMDLQQTASPNRSNSFVSVASSIDSIFSNDSENPITSGIKSFMKKNETSAKNSLFNECIAPKPTLDNKKDIFEKPKIKEIILHDNLLEKVSTKTPPKSESKRVSSDESFKSSRAHVCPHKTAVPGDSSDRNSPYPMVEVAEALKKVFENVTKISEQEQFISPMSCPPFRASIKDGYALKSQSLLSIRKVIGFVNAGDPIVNEDFSENECYKINTGAAVPKYADCVIQVEDTELIKLHENGSECEIKLKSFPKANCDIRDVGSDLREGDVLFETNGLMGVAEKTILASVGLSSSQVKPKIAIISTGDELIDPSQELREGQIFDSNTTMLKLLCEKFGFEVECTEIAKDDYSGLRAIVEHVMENNDLIISSGGVSMGDKDFVKKVLTDLNFTIHFGRVNVKPGKPMTFGSHPKGTSFFGLPGNPVSAFVTFHIFVLPALRYISGFPETKCSLPLIDVFLQDSKYELDPRPEYVRATLTYSTSKTQFLAKITSNQISSRIASLINADVLVKLPSSSGVANATLVKGSKLKAHIIDTFFLSNLIN